MNRCSDSNKKTPQSLLCGLCIAAFICTFPAFADGVKEKTSKWYIGGKVGKVEGSVSSTDIANDLNGSGVTVTNVAVDDSRNGWKFNVGFDLSEHIAIEAGYVDLKDVDVDITAVVSDPDKFYNQAKKIHPKSADGFTIESIYHLDLSDNIGLTGSIGLFNWDGEFNSRSLTNNQDISNDEVSGTDIYFGVGGGYQLTEEMTLKINWERYKLDKEDAQMWSIGVNYHFK